MKKLSLVLLAMLAFSFMGCQGWLNTDDPTPEPEPEPNPEVEAVITLEETSVVLHSGDTCQIQAECEFPITYSSENEYYATVSEEGLVTANFVGATTINLEAEGDSKTFEVTIEPVSNLYPEPEIEIGMSKDSIIGIFGEPVVEEDGILGFTDYSENVTMLMVMIDEEDLVTDYAVILETSFEEELDTFLGERYLFVQEQEGMKIYINALSLEETSMLIGSQNVEGEFLMAIYTSYSEEEAKAKAESFKAILKALGK